MANGNAYKNQFSAEDIINKLFQKGLMDENNTGFLQALIGGFFSRRSRVSC